MRDIEFSKLIGGIDEELAASAAPAHTARSKRDTVIPERSRFADFLHRAAAVAAAVLLLVLIPIGTARAAGVSVVLPFISREGTTTRLDYSAGLDRHEDAPEITANPAQSHSITHKPGQRFSLDTEEELRACVGGKIRMPGKETGLEFVSATGSIDEEGVSVTAKYRLNDTEIRIVSSYDTAVFGSEQVAYTIWIEQVIRTETREVCGVKCEYIYTPLKKYLSVVLEHETYLISGNVDVSVLESIFASMMGSSR